MLYDYVIIGSGMGGIASGLNLLNFKRKVLILEKNSLPGGLVTTFKRGRFEFDTSLYYLFDYGDETNPGLFKKILDLNNINLKTKVVDFNMRIKDLKTKDDFKINGDFESFRIELEKLKIDSTPAIMQLLKIIKEIHTALDYFIKNDNTYTKYHNFMKYLDMFTDVALKDLGIPKVTINRLAYIWVVIGTPIYKLSFIDFCDIMYKMIYTKQVVLIDKALDFSFKLVNAYQKKGGKILYNSEVFNITKENHVYYIKTKDNIEYKAKNVICDISPRYFYQNLVNEKTKEQLKLDNARSLSPNCFVVYLGLNASCDEIGLDNYHYYLFDDLRSEVCSYYMDTINHHTMEAIVPNVVNEAASPKNTTILIIKKTFYQNEFQELNQNNYAKLKEDIANKMILDFEKYFNIDIEEYIEEIEIASPKTFASYINSNNGSIFGYARSSYDNMIHRLISYEDEQTPNISFVGSNGVLGGFVNNAFLSGYYVTNKLLEKEGKNGEN